MATEEVDEATRSIELARTSLQAALAQIQGAEQLEGKKRAALIEDVEVSIARLEGALRRLKDGDERRKDDDEAVGSTGGDRDDGSAPTAIPGSGGGWG
jgi:hypothetical protein